MPEPRSRKSNGNGEYHREPGSLSLDERLHNIETDMEQLNKKMDKLIMLVLLGALGVGGATATNIVSMLPF